jgi:hypothetical protein
MLPRAPYTAACGDIIYRRNIESQSSRGDKIKVFLIYFKILHQNWPRQTAENNENFSEYLALAIPQTV